MFQFNVCSKRLAIEARPKGFAFQRALVLDRWSPDLVERAIADLCRHTEGDTWEQVARKLSRYGQWEFEDYRPEPRSAVRVGQVGVPAGIDVTLSDFLRPHL